MLNAEIENIILKANMRTNMDIMVTDDEKIIYYIGNTDNCKKYMYAEVSKEIKELMNIRLNEIRFLGHEETVYLIKDDEEKYYNQAIYAMYEDDRFDKFIIFNKVDGEFDENDRLIINSTKYLIEKYLASEK